MIKFSFKGASRSIAAIKAAAEKMRPPTPYAKAGVLGKNDARADEHTYNVKQYRQKVADPSFNRGIGNVDLALVHEFGTATVPERSFIRSSFLKHRNEYRAILAAFLRKELFNPKSAGLEKVMGLIGARMAADIKLGITAGDGIPPPNTPEVFMRKLLKGERGFNKTGMAPRTLVDTGQLLRSITWEVVTNGK